MSHGLKMIVLLREEMKRLGRKPVDLESAAVLDLYLTTHEIKLKKVRKNAPKPRARDAVFDLLAKLDGVADTKQLTRHGGSKIAGAKKQILDVMLEVNPDVTTDQVMTEINERWARWCRKHTDPKTQTVMALVTHWAELGGGPKTQAALLDVYQEPTGDWRRVAAVVLQCDPAVLIDKPWLDLGVDYRSAILKDMQKNGRMSA